MNETTIISGKALRHKVMKPFVTVPGGSQGVDPGGQGGSADDTDTPGDGQGTGSGTGGQDTGNGGSNSSQTSNPTMVSMEYLRDEDDLIFMPRTHTKAVQNASGQVLDDILITMESRLSSLEQGLAPNLKVADNLVTNSSSMALSARQGLTISTILDSENGDVVAQDASFLVLQPDAVTTEKIATDAGTTDKIANSAVTEDIIGTDAVTTDKIQNSSVTTEKLSATLQEQMLQLDAMTEWRLEVEERLDALEEALAQHQTNEATILQQNQWLLYQHQRMKHLDITASIYNVTADTNVQNSISWNDIRMSGLQINYSWHYYDEIDSQDYTPESISIVAHVHAPKKDALGNAIVDSTGTQIYDDSTVTLSTDAGLNDLPQLLKMRALEAGSSIVIRTTVHYCWLDWTKDYTITITA